MTNTPHTPITSCDARDTRPMCCDGRCLQGLRCPHQDACPVRAAAVEQQDGELSPMQKSRMANTLREAREREIESDLRRRYAAEMIGWRVFAWACIGVGAAVAVWGLWPS